MKNKWLLIVITIILAISITACSNGEKSNEDKSPETNSTNNNHLDKETQEKNENEENDDNKKDSILINEADIHEDSSITALVNKEYSLSKDYIPEDLVAIEVPTVLENLEVNQLRKEAANALKDMFTEAKQSDYLLYARSGYRSYQTQVSLFENYAAQHGIEEANRYSAKPGHSEHQTGLVMDVTSESMNLELGEAFGETEEGQWLQEHAHEFGFIIRYPKGKEKITGYIYEPWHIRYLGVDVATALYESDLTYEEYLYEEGLIDEIDAKKD